MDRFLIAPYDKESGLQKQLKPWLIPDTAFEELTNAYVFRGRVRKRFGSRWMGDTQLASRFRVSIGTTGALGVVNATVPLSGGLPIVTPAVGQMFSIGTEVFTVNDITTGAPNITLLRTNNAYGVANWNITTGVFTTANSEASGLTIYYYPALPVMGLRTYESPAVNDEVTVGFDTRFSYTYTQGVGWDRIKTESVAGDAFWTGTNADFFWTSTWLGAGAGSKLLFTTNFNQNEARGMRYLDATTWNRFRPQITNAGEYLWSARILIPFKNHLIALNTWEGTTTGTAVHYNNRARWCTIGSPLAADAWNQDKAGEGLGIDASTTESIISCEFVKDHLIVYFERSTWDLVYTGSPAYPFVWQQINTELGSESTFSIIPFDKVVIGVGQVGVHACNGANVERIDDYIPDEVFNIHNENSGIERIYGIRDYFVEMLYWSFPDNTRSSDTPWANRVLVFNYHTGTWAFNDDSITAFGYFWPQAGIAWDSETITWDSNISWNSGEMGSLVQQIVAGNQEGYTFYIDTNSTTNAPVIQITDMSWSANIITITCVDHNFAQDDFIYLQDIASVNGLFELLNTNIFKIVQIIDKDTFTIIPAAPISTDTYLGNGTISRVSNIQINTKEYNFYVDQSRNAFIQKVDFLVDSTTSGQITVDYSLSTGASPINSTVSPGQNLGTNILTTSPYTTVTFESVSNQARFWHPVYLQADGECIKLSLFLSDTQMQDTTVRECDFVLHALMFFTQPSSMRFE